MGTVAADWKREVAALGLNFNEISAANSGRKEKEGCDEREDEEEMRRMLLEEEKEEKEEEEEEEGLVPLVGEKRAYRAWQPGQECTGDPSHTAPVGQSPIQIEIRRQIKIQI